MTTNWYEIFYWLVVSDGVKRFFDMASNWFTFFTVISFVIMVITTIAKGVSLASGDSDTDKGWEYVKNKVYRFFYVSLTLCLVTWTAYVIIPTKRDCLLIVAGGAVGNFMTTDSSAKALPADIAQFLHVGIRKEIASLTSDEQKELGISSPKDRLIEKAKTLSKEELLKYIESDTSLSKR